MSKFSIIFFSLLLITSCAIAPDKKFETSELGDQFNINPDITINSSLEKSAEYSMKAKDYYKSAAIYEQLLANNLDNKNYMFKYAESSRLAGKADISIQYYDKYLAIEPNDLNAIEGKGLAYMAKADFVNATKLLKQVLNQDKNRWKTMNAIAIALIFNERFEDGIKYFKAALKIEPNNISIKNNLALALAFNANYDESLKIYDDLSNSLNSHDPAIIKIDMNRSLIYAANGNLEKAESIASKYLKDAELYNNMGVYANIAHDNLLAKSYLNKALFMSNQHYVKAWDNLKNID